MKRQKVKTWIAIVIILLAVSIMCSAGTRPGHPLEKYNNEVFRCRAAGPVKKTIMTVFTDQALPDKPNTGEQSYIIEESFDTLQIKTGEKIYTTKNLLVARAVFLHNRNGFAFEVIYMDLFDKVLNRITYSYDKNGNWKQNVNYDRYYNPLEVFNYYYTPEGYISEIRKTDEGGNLLKSQIFLYDSLGYNTDVMFYDSLGMQIAGAEFLYNSKGRVCDYRLIDKNLLPVELYQINYQNDTIVISALKETFSQGEPQEKTLTRYDPLGNILEIIYLDPYSGDTLQRREYLYEWDLWGNWTRQLITGQDKDTIGAERIIEYYISNN